MLGNLIGQDLRRWWYSMRAPAGPLREYYRKDYATLDTPYTKAEFLAIDLEATGLNPDKDEILSIGYVPVINGVVRLAGAGYHLVRPTSPLPAETVVIHGLTDSQLAEAPTIDEVLPHVLRAMAGRIPVAHHARIEKHFLSRACRSLYNYPLDVPYADTLLLEKRVMARKATEVVAQGQMRLGALRERYGLPRYRAHDALVDAIAAAEVFLAQAAQASGRKDARLDDLLG